MVQGPRDFKFLSKKRIMARLGEMESERAAHIGDWRRVTEFIRPARGKYLHDGTEESKRPTSMVNSTPHVASRTLAAGMIGGASSPWYEWFKLFTDDADLMKWGPFRTAIEQREKVLYSYLSRTNFYESLQVEYGDSGDFGTSCGIIDEHPEQVFTHTAFSPGEYFIDTDAAGDISSVYRRFEQTVLQIVTKYGYEKASREVKLDYDRGNYQTKFWVIEAIEPNQDFRAGDAGWRGKPYTRFTFQELNLRDDDSAFLILSGYNEWPCPNLRWDLASGNKWGWGPGIAAVGDAAALQTLEFRDAQAIEKAVKPPLSAPNYLKNKPISHAPGGVTYYDPFTASGGAKLEPIYQIMPGILQALDAKRTLIEQRLNSIYYKDLFFMLSTSDRREITAREVEEKHGEKLLGLGPVLQRTHRNTLDISIMRIYSILQRANLFPPIPQDLAKREALIGVRYTSSLAYAQRAAGAASLERFLGFLGNVAQVFPEATKKVDIMESVDHYADAIGVPSTTIVPTKKAQADAAKAAAQQQAPVAAETAVAGAEAAKLMSETDTTRPSALQFLMNRQGVQ